MRDVVVRPEGPAVPGADRRAAIRVMPGGSAANLAAWLAFAGVRPVLVGRIGHEDHAHQTALLSAAGVRPVLAAEPEAPTGIAVAMIAPDGERSFYTDRGANERLARADLPDALLEGIDLVHVSGYALLCPGPRAAVLDFLAAAGRRGVPASVDPGATSVIEETGAAAFLLWTAFAATCCPNADEAAALTGATEPQAQLDALRRHYGTVVIKRGALGAVAAEGPDRCAVPAVPAAVADTTGAGDAFLAGFLAARLGGAGLAESLARGCALGALATTTLGGRPPAESACNAQGPMPI